jgi:hypothetical protein
MTKPDANLKFRIIHNEEVEGKYDLLADDGHRNFVLDTCLSRAAANRAKALAERTALLCGRVVIA